MTLGPSGHIMGMFHKLNRKGGYFLQCRGLHHRDLNLLSHHPSGYYVIDKDMARDITPRNRTQSMPPKWPNLYR